MRKRIGYILILGVTLSVITSYLYVKNEQKEYLINIDAQINKATNNKESVSDGYDLSVYNRLVLYEEFPDSLKTKLNRPKNGFGGFGAEMETPTALSRQLFRTDIEGLAGINYIILTKDSLSYDLEITKSYDIVYYGVVNNYLKTKFNKIFQRKSDALLSGIIDKNEHQHLNERIDEMRNLKNYKNKFYKFSDNKVMGNPYRRDYKHSENYTQWYDLKDSRIYVTTKREHYRIEPIEGKFVSELGLKFLLSLGIYSIISLIIFLIIKIFK